MAAQGIVINSGVVVVVVVVVVVIQVVFAFAQGRQWYTIDGFECRPTSRGLSVL